MNSNISTLKILTKYLGKKLEYMYFKILPNMFIFGEKKYNRNESRVNGDLGK